MKSQKDCCWLFAMMCCCGDMKDVVGIGDCVERKDRMNSIHLAKSRHFIQGV